ncbi:MAG: AAA family ATPase [Chloroflexaceae bacterium]|nr:AAA family ATPase [Chloroflexaceae bacterium]
MHLLRVQVPEFRALKDVDITFEKELFPKVFPLGSLNGGGKSTLLQLIFTLLHCSDSEERQIYLLNLLKIAKIESNSEIKTLAKIDIYHEGEIVCLEFICLRNVFSEEPSDKLAELISNIEEEQNIRQVCKISWTQYERESLFCYVEGMIGTQISLFLSNLSSKVFLAAPPTQVFLFLERDDNRALFQAQKNHDSFKIHDAILSAKSKLPGFFTYDFVSVDLILEAFQKAINLDFKEYLETGNYGENVNKLISEYNLLLLDKQIALIPDESGKLTKIAFKLNSNNGKTINLGPEDFSHGELKRLSIYSWIKNCNMTDAIVLMDEIEIALHPDWQYQIVNDLVEWSPGNQYILATHSYELCQALTPAHVKEIEPRLLKQSANS